MTHAEYIFRNAKVSLLMCFSLLSFVSLPSSNRRGGGNHCQHEIIIKMNRSSVFTLTAALGWIGIIHLPEDGVGK